MFDMQIYKILITFQKLFPIDFIAFYADFPSGHSIFRLSGNPG